jgi:hypothetical protein
MSPHLEAKGEEKVRKGEENILPPHPHPLKGV